MRILPAIDLKDQMCVRLVKGDYATAHKVAEDAVETAKKFLDAGAELIHMVDLDGAKDGTHPNYPVVRRVIEETGASVELGGGIRTMEDIARVLELGVKRVIIGSAAVKNPPLVKEACEKYGDKIAVGIDALSGTVRTEGWLNDSGMDYIEFAKLMESYGVKTIIFTDIDKDGMLSGPNFEQLQALRDAVSCGIVASGGVSTLEDIARLRDMKIDEAIAGKAVYTGQLDVRAAIETAKEVG
ncbi:MAG: 1-(5-phosphoribosyl)-5-[(5-phosphoribosylamino)methylideneamino]imidazole-4-carboxamide isomerase [Clostridiales bacterium]|nr:1-(5-phosphoribosyl)-5-[(5-phosphoribosylamino)methylideneamino]imidazole-4-carboxamide isomerase [Clostridiales bacterium]